MFEHLESYHGVIVTGPQRAGTTITAQMIAHELQRRFIDEAEVGFEDVDQIRALQRGEPYVLQCPCLCYRIHEFGGPQVAIVLSRRPVSEIQVSQQRVNWLWEQAELEKYGLTCGSIPEVKYAIWDRWQKPLLGSHAYESQYRDLERHPLWVPDDLRRHFAIKQTRG